MWSGIFLYLYLQFMFLFFDLKSINFPEALGDLYLHVLDTSLTAGIVIVLVLFVRLLLKGVPKIYSYVLWSVVLIRLLCPNFIVSSVGVVPVLDSVWEEYTLSDEKISFGSAVETVGNVVGALFEDKQEELQRPMGESYGDDQQRISIKWWEIGVLFFRFLWPVGMVIMVIYSQVHYWWIKKRLRDSARIGKRVYLSDHISTPFVIGVFRPSIYLPSALEKDNRQFILYHELHHIQRRDHVIKMIAFILLCVHWFNPLVWIAFWLMSRDMEMSCDEAVVKELKQDLKADVRADYSSLLLELSTGESMIGGTPLAFGEGNTRARIFNLAGERRITELKHLYTVLIIVVAGFCLLTNKDDTKTMIDTVSGDETVSQVWEVKGIIYGESSIGDYVNYQFKITENGYFDIVENGDSINESGEKLQFSEISLSKWKFDELFVDQKAFWSEGRNLAGSIRRHNRRAWCVFMDRSHQEPVLYYLLQQTNGKVYLVMGRYDKQNFTDWFDDSSRIRWMCELHKVENMDGPVTMRNSLFGK